MGTCFVCWGGVKGNMFTDVVENSYPPTMCHACADSETQCYQKQIKKLLDTLLVDIGTWV